MLTARFTEALDYAREHHASDKRKGTEIPYVAHLLAVSALVLEHGGSEDEAIAALLHDVAEDRGGEPALADIDARFGSEVAEIVRGCSDTTARDKEDWDVRKRRYVEHLEEEADRPVLLVALADKVHNTGAMVKDLRAHGPKLWQRFNAGPEKQLWYYRTLREIFARKLPGPLAEELDRNVAAIEQFVGTPSDPSHVA